MTFWRACKTTSNAIENETHIKYDFLYQVFLMGLQLRVYQPFIPYRSYLNPQ